MNEPILSDAELASIGRDLTDAAGRGNPMHKSLWHSIDSAMFVAVNSPKFRDILARIVAGDR